MKIIHSPSTLHLPRWTSKNALLIAFLSTAAVAVIGGIVARYR